MLAVPISGTQTETKPTMHQMKKWTREDNKNSNPAQRESRKQMIVIWTDSAKSNRKSQKLADQEMLIIKKGRLSDLEILEICGQVNREELTQREPPK